MKTAIEKRMMSYQTDYRWLGNRKYIIDAKLTKNELPRSRAARYQNEFFLLTPMQSIEEFF